MSWYGSPFTAGSKYRVLKDYSELGHELRVGEVVVLSADAYDPKLGVIRFWFTHIGTGKSNVFHVWDDTADLNSVFREHFSRVD